MTRCVALLRGINVGRAKPVPMDALRDVFESLGHTAVVTVLRSGNVVFDVAGPGTGMETGPASVDVAALARGIEAAVSEAIGVDAAVLVFDAAGFRDIAAENPFVDRASDPSRLIVSFLSAPPPAGLELPDDAEIAPEAIAVGRLAVYQWLPDGVLKAKVGRSFWSQFDGTITGRNARTVGRLAALAG